MVMRESKVPSVATGVFGCRRFLLGTSRRHHGSRPDRAGPERRGILTDRLREQGSFEDGPAGGKGRGDPAPGNRSTFLSGPVMPTRAWSVTTPGGTARLGGSDRRQR